MLRLLLVLAIVVAAWWYIFSFKKKDKKAQKLALQRLALYGSVGVILGLILTGRISALFAAVIALIPWVERAFLLKKVFDKTGAGRKSSGSSAAKAKGNITLDEAKNILGIQVQNNEITEEMVNLAYKKLIQKNHPDAGGSDFLARQIIEARNVLLDYLRQNS